MTITAASIPLVSKYTVSDSGDFTNALFTSLSADAKTILDEDDPGLPSALYDRCHALMVCHLYEMRDPQAGLKSFTSGDFQGSKEAGVTTYLLQYRDIIDRYQYSTVTGAIPSDGIERCDVDMGVMALDNEDPISFGEFEFS